LREAGYCLSQKKRNKVLWAVPNRPPRLPAPGPRVPPCARPAFLELQSYAVYRARSTPQCRQHPEASEVKGLIRQPTTNSRATTTRPSSSSLPEKKNSRSAAIVVLAETEGAGAASRHGSAELGEIFLLPVSDVRSLACAVSYMVGRSGIDVWFS
jgi:hypothetical protein